MGVARLQRGDGLQPYLAFVLLQKNMQHQSDCRLPTLRKQFAFRNAYAPIRLYNPYVMHFCWLPSPSPLCSKLSFVVRGAANINDIHS